VRAGPFEDLPIAEGTADGIACKINDTHRRCPPWPHGSGSFLGAYNRSRRLGRTRSSVRLWSRVSRGRASSRARLNGQSDREDGCHRQLGRLPESECGKEIAEPALLDHAETGHGGLATSLHVERQSYPECSYGDDTPAVVPFVRCWGSRGSQVV
jgi:hypothetical protein